MSSEPAAVREVEIKLRVPGLFRMPDLVAAQIGVARAKRQVVRSLHSVYYDTADLRLYRWGVTLRRREGGHDAGWHMKLPVEGHGMGTRDELQLPLSAGAPGSVPEALARIVLPMTRGEPLVEVGDLHNERTPYLLYDDSGRAIAELVDDSVTILDEGQIAEKFREIEVEALVDDAPLETIFDLLCDAGAVPSTGSKAADAFGPAAHRPPDVGVARDVGPRDSAADAIQSFLQKHIRAFILQDVRVRRDLPDAVHQMRVAARRLRSGLKAFGDVVDSDWADGLREELGWAARELGGARDTEVMLERLDRHAADLGARDAALVRAIIDPQLGDRLEGARGRAISSLESPRHLALLNSLVDAANSPRLSSLAKRESRDVFPELVDRAFRRLRRKVSQLRLDGPADSWHQARIAAKRARYAADAVTGVFGGEAKRLASALSEVTEILGEHQDACVAQDVLRELAASSTIDGRTGFALGLLHEHEFEEELHNRLEFERIWPGVLRVHKKTKLN